MTGTWKITVHTYMGDMRSTLQCEVKDGVLTGTVTDDGNGATVPITNASFDGKNFAYELTIKTPVGEMTNHLTGELLGDTLKGTSVNAMGSFDFDAVRA